MRTWLVLHKWHEAKSIGKNSAVNGSKNIIVLMMKTRTQYCYVRYLLLLFFIMNINCEKIQ